MSLYPVIQFCSLFYLSSGLNWWQPWYNPGKWGRGLYERTGSAFGSVHWFTSGQPDFVTSHLITECERERDTAVGPRRKPYLLWARFRIWWLISQWRPYFSVKQKSKKDIFSVKFAVFTTTTKKKKTVLDAYNNNSLFPLHAPWRPRWAVVPTRPCEQEKLPLPPVCLPFVLMPLPHSHSDKRRGSGGYHTGQFRYHRTGDSIWFRRLRVQSYETTPITTCDLEANHKSRLSPGLLTNQLHIRGSNHPLLWFD